MTLWHLFGCVLIAVIATLTCIGFYQIIRACFVNEPDEVGDEHN